MTHPYKRPRHQPGSRIDYNKRGWLSAGQHIVSYRNFTIPDAPDSLVHAFIVSAYYNKMIFAGSLATC